MLRCCAGCCVLDVQAMDRVEHDLMTNDGAVIASAKFKK